MSFHTHHQRATLGTHTGDAHRHGTATDRHTAAVKTIASQFEHAHSVDPTGGTQ